MDGDNPTRRYKWFRPRQAARGSLTTDAPTNKATVSLFNDSKGSYVLVVRAFTVDSAAGHPIAAGYLQGAQGSAAGTVSPLWAGEATMRGSLYYLDTATALTPDWTFETGINQGYVAYPFPFAIIPPGWNLTFQNTTATEALTVNILWEAVFPDELDWLY